MTDADKLNPSPNNGNDNNKLMESIGAANALDVRRDGFGRGAYGVPQNDTSPFARLLAHRAAPLVGAHLGGFVDGHLGDDLHAAQSVHL